MEEIEQLVAAGDFAGTAAFCESFELDLRHEEEAPPASLAVYKLHILAYMLTRDTHALRFLWKRLPPEVRADEEVAALWRVGQHLWRKDAPAVQQASRAYGWSHPLYASLVARLQQDVLDASLKAVGAAYSRISAAALARKLGVDAGAARQLAAAAGWRFHADGECYAPCAPPAETQRSTGLQQLQTLADYVAHVEYEVG